MWDLNSVYFVSDGRFCNKDWPHSVIIDVNQLLRSIFLELSVVAFRDLIASGNFLK